MSLSVLFVLLALGWRQLGAEIIVDLLERNDHPVLDVDQVDESGDLLVSIFKLIRLSMVGCILEMCN